MRHTGLRRIHVSSAYNVLLVAACVCMTLYAVYFFQPKHVKRRMHVNTTAKLLYLHSFPSYYALQEGPTHFRDCDMSNCQYVIDAPEVMEDSAAILFFTHHVKPHLSFAKPPGQVWIYFSVESPYSSFNEHFGSPLWEGRFNWTMTYRLDSDIKFGYGDVVKGSKVKSKDYYAIAKKKTKLVAWFVSNCNPPSRRMEYVNLLSQYIQVDVYGSCGKFKCSRSSADECSAMLQNDYKFYLSFENSLCKDYVTEKLFKTLKLDIIPVVRGGANYSAILPDKMAINSADFASARDLAEYLKHLDGNLEEYVSYLKWKDRYHVVEPQPFPHCALCERVHQPARWRNVYTNVNDWWTKSICREPNDLK